MNNYYKAGPGTKNKTTVTQVSVASSGNASGSPYMGYSCRYHIKGNHVTAANSANYDWTGVAYDSGLSIINGERYIPDAKHLYGEQETYVKDKNNVDCIRLKMDDPIDAGEVTTHVAKTAFDKVLKYGGSSLHRDAADTRYAQEALLGTTTYTGALSERAGILDYINDPEGDEDETTASYPTLKEETRPAGFDSDQDGIPDAWETANGLNPYSASDGKTYTLDPQKRYTNLEVYLNSLVQDIMIAGNEDAQTWPNTIPPSTVRMAATSPPSARNRPASRNCPPKATAPSSSAPSATTPADSRSRPQPKEWSSSVCATATAKLWSGKCSDKSYGHESKLKKHKQARKEEGTAIAIQQKAVPLQPILVRGGSVKR